MEKHLRIGRIVAVCLAGVMAPSGCTSASFTHDPAPPVVKISSDQPPLDPRMSEAERVAAADRADSLLRAEYERVRSGTSTPLLCVESGGWARDGDELAIKGRGAKKLSAEPTASFINKSVERINDANGVFYDHLRLVEKRSSDDLFVRLAIAYGFVVMYRSAVFLASIDSLARCDLSPFAPQIRFVRELLDDTGHGRLAQLLDSLEAKNPGSPQVQTWQIQRQTLLGQQSAGCSAPTSSLEFEDDGLPQAGLGARAHAWCGYAAQQRGEADAAAEHWETAHGLLDDARASEYAGRALRSAGK